jgi:lipopolysaccharide biosynthesis protein
MVRLDRVVEAAYEMKLYQEDLAGIDQLKPNFYQQYFKLQQEDLPLYTSVLPTVKSPRKILKARDDKIAHHLHMWYIKLLEERVHFMQKSGENEERVREVPSEIREEDYEEMQKSLKVLEDKVVQN